VEEPVAVVGRCPVCNHGVHVTEVKCGNCGTEIRGRFSLCRFCQLSDKQRNFIEVFLVARGNIKEVERKLGISYPTVRARLDAVLKELGYDDETDAGKDMQPDKETRMGILQSVKSGDLSVQDAIKALKAR